MRARKDPSGRELARAGRPLYRYLYDTTDYQLPARVDIEDLLGEWSDALGDEESLRERLALDGLSPDDVRAWANEGGESTDESPQWCETVRQLSTTASALGDGTAEDLVESNQNLPFVHVTAPLVEARAQTVTYPADVEPDAVASLERWLLFRLTRLVKHPLFIQFKYYQENEHGTGGYDEPAPETGVYDEFCRRLLREGYEPLWHEYPALARYVATVAVQWSEAVEDPGVGLALAGVQGLDLDVDYSRAIRRLARRHAGDITADDSLYSGTAGWIRFLQVAGQRLDDDGFDRQAADALQTLLDRAGRNGWARLEGHASGNPRIAFCPGLAGVGYAALNVASGAGPLPAVTLFE
jgi:hypothetical protein